MEFLDMSDPTKFRSNEIRKKNRIVTMLNNCSPMSLISVTKILEKAINMKILNIWKPVK